MLNRKYIFLFTSFILFPICLFSQTKVLFETSLGNFVIQLYDETPNHKNNFIQLVESGFYNNLLFHRVVDDFVIQTGDPESATAQPGQILGTGSSGYTIPPEFNRTLFHKKGAVAAARQPDNLNPKRSSSGSQFYIVQGTVFSEEELYELSGDGSHSSFSSKQIRAYTSIGGSPNLDDKYTVFGEVIEGLEIIEKISSVLTDSNERPLTDVRILNVHLIN